MSEQLRLNIIEVYEPEVEVRLTGAVAAFYSKDNHELYNFLYFNKIKCTLEPVRGVVCSVLEVNKALDLLKSLSCFDKTTLVFLEILQTYHANDVPIVLKKLDSDECTVSYFQNDTLREVIVSNSIRTALKVCGIPFVSDENHTGLLKERTRVVCEYSVDNILHITPSDPSKVKELGLEVCWPLSAVKFACPALLGNNLKNRPGFIFKNNNYYESITEKFLDHATPEEVIRALRRLVLTNDLESLNYIKTLVCYVSNIYEKPLVITSKTKIELWREFLKESNVVTPAEILDFKGIEQYDVIVLDDIEPSKLPGRLGNHFKTDLDVNVLYLIKNDKTNNPALLNHALSVIRPLEFSSTKNPEEYYVDGIGMLSTHVNMYLYNLESENSLSTRLIYTNLESNPEKIRLGAEAYSQKFSNLVRVLADQKSLEIIGLKAIKELGLVLPNLAIKTILTDSYNLGIYRVLYDTHAKSNLTLFSEFDLIFIDEEQE